MLSLLFQHANEIVQEIHETHTVRGLHRSHEQGNWSARKSDLDDVHYENLAFLI